MSPRSRRSLLDFTAVCATHADGNRSSDSLSDISSRSKSSSNATAIRDILDKRGVVFKQCMKALEELKDTDVGSGIPEYELYKALMTYVGQAMRDAADTDCGDGTRAFADYWQTWLKRYIIAIEEDYEASFNKASRALKMQQEDAERRIEAFVRDVSDGEDIEKVEELFYGCNASLWKVYLEKARLAPPPYNAAGPSSPPRHRHRSSEQQHGAASKRGDWRKRRVHRGDGSDLSPTPPASLTPPPPPFVKSSALDRNQIPCPWWRTGGIPGQHNQASDRIAHLLDKIFSGPPRSDNHLEPNSSDSSERPTAAKSSLRDAEGSLIPSESTGEASSLTDNYNAGLVGVRERARRAFENLARIAHEEAEGPDHRRRHDRHHHHERRSGLERRRHGISLELPPSLLDSESDGEREYVPRRGRARRPRHNAYVESDDEDSSALPRRHSRRTRR